MPLGVYVEGPIGKKSADIRRQLRRELQNGGYHILEERVSRENGTEYIFEVDCVPLGLLRGPVKVGDYHIGVRVMTERHVSSENRVGSSYDNGHD